MTPSLPRPDEATLRKYLLGELSEAESGAVEQFLESSPEVPPLPALPADDTLVSALRGQAAETPPDSAKLRKVMNWLERIGMRSDIDQQTAASAGVEPVEAEDPTQEVLALLAPAEGEGLGTLGGLRITRVLGRGGMGVVLEAADPKLGRRVALKAMRPALSVNPTAKQRFLREAKAAAAVEHDHIVPIYQIGEDRGILFLTMPFLKGEPLDAKLKREGRLPVAEIARLGRQTAEGLAAAHEAGLIHRDIKPGNLWLEAPSGRVKVLDFGLARASSSQDAQLTTSGMVVGTPAYMAPEQAAGKALDARCDLFSLGVVLYRAATGELPFKGDSPMAIIHSLALDTPAHPSDLNPDVPRRLGDLIERLLAKEPGKRPATAAEVAKALAAIEHDLANDTIPLAALPAPIVQPLDPWEGIDDEEEPTQVSPEESRLRRKPKNRALIAAGLLALAAAITAVVVVIIKDKDGKEVARVNVPDGGSVEVKDDGKAKKDGPKPVVGDAERKAAEWVIRNKGTVWIEIAGKQEAGISAIDNLPVRQFRLVRIYFHEPTTASEKELLEHLRGLKSLEDLGLVTLPLSEAGLEQVSSMPGVAEHLVDLNVNASPVSAAWLQHLKRFKHLKGLSLQTGDDLSGAALKVLLDLPPLQALSISGYESTDASLRALRGLKVTALTLGGKGITDAGIDHLLTMPQLANLTLGETSVTDAGIILLKTLPALTGLSLDGGKLTEEGYKQLATFPKLADLRVGHLPITDAGLAAFKGSKRLTYVSLDDVKITDAGLAHLSGMENLMGVGLSRVPIGDAGLEHLKALPSLQALTLSKTNVTEAGVKKLAAALPDCRITWDGGVIEPKQAAPSSDKEKPFRLVRGGKPAGEFKSAAGAFAEMHNGDILEIAGDGPFDLHPIQWTERSLHLRAAASYRPRFVLPATLEKQPHVWLQIAKAPVTIEGCDFDAAAQSHFLQGDGERWEIRNCRILAASAALYTGPALKVTDCLLRCFNVFGFGPDMHAELTNNLIYTESPISLAEAGGQIIILRRNTICLAAGAHQGLISSTNKQKPTTVEAEGNAFFFNTTNGNRAQPVGPPVSQPEPWKEWKGRVRWSGKDNFYVNLGTVHGENDLERFGPIVTDLDGWNARLEKPETGSKAVTISSHTPGLLAWDVVSRLSTEELLAVIERKVAAEQKRTGLADLGPEQFDRIGPGAAYFRTLPDAPKDRPEALGGGPIVLLRNGKEVEGYATLAAAFAKAAAGDVIEIRTEKTLDALSIPVNAGRLTLRAGSGYRAAVKGLDTQEGTQLTIEGITFTEKLSGRISRVVNCSVPWNRAAHVVFGDGDKPAEVVNSILVGRGSSMSGRVVFRNSVLRSLTFENGPGDTAAEFDRCVFWNSSNNGADNSFVFHVRGDKPVKLAVRRTLIETWFPIAHDPTNKLLSWSGERNVYRVGSTTWTAGLYYTGSLAQWQKHFTSPETGSTTGMPWMHDPAKWAFAAGTPGEGFGADVSKVATRP
jgi:serine/threonine protein kinase